MPTTLDKPKHRPAPVLQPTRHDKVTAGMMSAIVALVLCLAALVVLRPIESDQSTRPIPIVMVELPVVDETADDESAPVAELETPDVEMLEPALAESSDVELTEMLETVVELSDAASVRIEQARNADQDSPQDRSSGPRRRIGEIAIPRERRWFIRFSESSLDEYSRQLDHFRIELGALFPDGRLILMRDGSSEKPVVRRLLDKGEGEDRLYMTWRGGRREQADKRLFARAGIDASSATIVHFYDAKLEELIEKIEVGYRNISASNIRRTYFHVRKTADGGYTFVVISQSFLR